MPTIEKCFFLLYCGNLVSLIKKLRNVPFYTRKKNYSPKIENRNGGHLFEWQWKTRVMVWGRINYLYHEAQSLQLPIVQRMPRNDSKWVESRAKSPKKSN
jgi:hypothetical protein